MGKTKTRTKSSSDKDILRSTNTRLVKSAIKNFTPQKSVEDLLTEAADLLEQSQPEAALPLVEEALRRLDQEHGQKKDIEDHLLLVAQAQPTLPQALVLEAEINLALGDADTARSRFVRATDIDPDGAIVSAEPYLWLSQLSEQGGRESIHYFVKATEVLRNEIEVIEEARASDEQYQRVLDEKRAKLAEALCGMTEVYMTDLSWEEDAEGRCEQFVTEAVAVCPEHLSAGVLQTLASVRISQERIDEAKGALAHSMTIWKDLPLEVEDPARPDFATRVSLARLLMEVEVEADALVVLEGLMKEDDQSVETSYLRGWCYVLLGQKPDVSVENKQQQNEQAKLWLDTCLKLYRAQMYEDDKLLEHALELIGQLNKALGIEDHDDDWEDAEEDDDEVDGDDVLEIDGEVHNDDVEMT